MRTDIINYLKKEIIWRIVNESNINGKWYQYARKK